MNKEEIKKYIIERLNHFDEISISNPYYNNENCREDKKILIKELEENFNCEIDYISYEIKFN